MNQATVKAAPLGVAVCVLVAACATRERAPSHSPRGTPAAVPSEPERPAPPAASLVTAAPPAPVRTPEAVTLVELAPGLRVDARRGIVEIDGKVPIEANAGDVVYLETLVCTQDSKEHESLVVTPVKPSAVHTAILLAGAQPGTPGSWRFEGQRVVGVEPTGPAVEVMVRVRGRDDAPLASWVRDQKTGAALADQYPGTRWVFGGSAFVTRAGNRLYGADLEGSIVGLATFGSETVGWSRVYSPDSSVDEPHLAATPGLTPPADTPVTVVLRVAR